MRAVIQRVSKASVIVGGKVTAGIGQGLLVLLGIEETDGRDDILWLSGKIARLRIFSDGEGKMNHSIQEVKGEILVISQFTLYARTKKGNRPSFERAAKPYSAVSVYEEFVKQLERDLGKPVQTGKFGEMMEVELVNDGPVTIVMDTKAKE